MSLNKGIESGKEHRRAYRKSKAFDRSCRNHGACGYCQSNRFHGYNRLREFMKDQMREFFTALIYLTQEGE